MSRPENHHLINEWNAARKNATKIINPSEISKKDFDIYSKGIKQ